MVVQASLRLRHHGCFSQRCRDGVVLTQVSGERGMDLFVLQAPTAARAAAELAAAEAHVARKADIVGREGGTIVFRGVNPPGGVIAAIHAGRASILWPLVYRDGEEHYTLVAPTRADLASLRERLAAMADVEVERIVEVEPDAVETMVPVGDLLGLLTARQREVLLAATRAGYYESPRALGIRDLAARLGLSDSTVQEHLQKAEAAVVRRVAGLLAEHAPDEGARGRGRPPRR